MKTINDFSISSNLTDNFKHQLIDFSNNDPLIIKNTTDKNRFSSKEKLKSWLEKNPPPNKRQFYFLTPTNNLNQLAGISWLTKKALPKSVAKKLPPKQLTTSPTWTYAIRLYANARGNKLSIPFLQKTLQLFWQKYPNQPVWLNTKTTNQAAQKLFKKTGFEFFHNDEERFWGVITQTQASSPHLL